MKERGCRKQAQGDSKRVPVIGDTFIIKDNLVYLADIEKPRLVIPKEYGPVILHLGHTVPRAGHLGQAKTYNRIAQHFYWPGLYKEVMNYCNTFHDCQVVASTKLSRPRPITAITYPIMNVPYERIAMDNWSPAKK